MQQVAKQQGITLIEMLIVLMILAFLTVGFFSSSNSMMRSYRFSSDKLHELRESRKALETSFNELRLASFGSVEIKNSNTSISYTVYDINESSSKRTIFLDSDAYLCQNISGPGLINTTNKLVSQPIHNFQVKKDNSKNIININIYYTDKTSMSITLKPLNQ